MMIDLSSNNGTGHNFRTLYEKAGQRRVYLKIVQGTHYVNPLYKEQRNQAIAAKLMVGAYDYLEPLSSTPAQAAQFLLSRLPKTLVPGRDERPAIDCEAGNPTRGVGLWIIEVAKIITAKTKVKPLIYGSGHWLEACEFKVAPGPLWLAAYGRDDGREYPVGKLPKPWKKLTAHQYTSNAKVLGIRGECDLSHIFVFSNVDVPKPRTKK